MLRRSALFPAAVLAYGLLSGEAIAATCPSSPRLSDCQTNPECRIPGPSCSRCDALVKAEYDAHRRRNAAVPRKKIFRAGRPTFKRNLVDGYFNKYVPRNPRVTGTSYRNRTPSLFSPSLPSMPGGDVRRGIEGAVNLFPERAHRNPAWDTNGPANGQEITSCDEYVYEKFYGWSRFEDSVAACYGNRSYSPEQAFDCAWRMAYDVASPPKIAGVPLKRKDRQDIAGISLKTGVFPKNEFFKILGPRSTDNPAMDRLNELIRNLGQVFRSKSAELRQMVGIIEGGRTYYGIPENARAARVKYPNEWAFHRTLRELNTRAQVTPAEFEDASARQAEFARAVKDAVECFVDITREGDSYQSAVQIWEVQVRRDRRAPRPSSATLDAVEQRCQIPRVPADAKPPGPPKMKKTCDSEIPLPVYEPPQVACEGPICKAVNILLDEFYRMKTGEGGCLDVTKFECDWSPKLFLDRFVTAGHYLKEREAAFETCNRWWASEAPKNNLAALERYFGGQQAALERNQALLKKVPALPLQRGDARQSVRRFGQRYEKGESWGDADWFEASYNANVGWDLKTTAVRTRANVYSTCKLEGEAGASFNASARALGRNYSLVDVRARAVVNKRSEELQGKAGFKLDFKVFGNEIYMVPDSRERRSGKNWLEMNLNRAWPAGEDGPAQLFGGKGESGHVTFNFPAGPFTIGLEFWLEYAYGGEASAKAHFTDCEKTSDWPAGIGSAANLYEATVRFTPWASLSGGFQVGAGIPVVGEVGVRGRVNLIDIKLPFTGGVALGTEQRGATGTAKPFIQFGAGVDLVLDTLKGRLSVFVEALCLFDECAIDEEWEIFSWAGLGPFTIPLLQFIDKERTKISIDVFPTGD